MRTRLLASSLALSLAWAPAPALAQETDTLADIRQDLTVLNVEIQRLRRELSTTGGASVPPTAGPLLERVELVEAEITRLTARTEELEFRIQRIVEDGTNRIGDLEFRLVELEGGDVSQLGETSTLGGDALAAAPAPVPAPAPAPEGGGGELAVSEQADFEAAASALGAGEYQRAAELFTTFNQTYPGGPLAVSASLGRGDALQALGDTREASRAYLDAYNAAPEGPRAPEALLKLGQGLGALGQTDAACQILAQLAESFPGTGEGVEAPGVMSSLGCS